VDLDGRVALVAGSSSGIGAAIAKLLARDGASVVVHGRSSDSANVTVGEIERAGRTAKMVLGELTDAASVERIAAHALEAFGRVDVLVNSAGASPTYGPWLEPDPSLVLGERSPYDGPVAAPSIISCPA
jgi:3-oxoacyl-[acyl-carrier protein] reductase